MNKLRVTLIRLMLRYFATCSIVNKLRVSFICLILRYFATYNIVNKAQSESNLFDAEIFCY